MHTQPLESQFSVVVQAPDGIKGGKGEKGNVGPIGMKGKMVRHNSLLRTLMSLNFLKERSSP